MATYDHGGECPCGLFRYCDEDCSSYPTNEEPSHIKEVKRKTNKKNKRLMKINIHEVMKIK